MDEERAARWMTTLLIGGSVAALVLIGLFQSVRESKAAVAAAKQEQAPTPPPDASSAESPVDADRPLEVEFSDDPDYEQLSGSGSFTLRYRQGFCFATGEVIDRRRGTGIAPATLPDVSLVGQFGDAASLHSRGGLVDVGTVLDAADAPPEYESIVAVAPDSVAWRTRLEWPLPDSGTWLLRLTTGEFVKVRLAGVTPGSRGRRVFTFDYAFIATRAKFSSAGHYLDHGLVLEGRRPPARSKR